ncbi:MAG: accessory gene regulator B family protein [Firmicutes bacterium]|nr:accessory gene regulator B family protein [Bacillota bacterium]
MNWISKVSGRLAAAARGNKPEMTDDEYETIAFGLYVLISDLIKLLIIIIFSLVLGFFLYTAVALISFGAIRWFMGGVHAKTWWGCMGACIFLFLGIPGLALYFAETPAWLVSMAGFIVTAVIIHFHAPADHENKPVINGSRRMWLKKRAYLVLIFMSLIAGFIVKQPYSNIIMFAVLVEAIMVLPLVYKITRNKHGQA